MSTRSGDTTLVGIGTTFDYSLPFEPMCRMIADAGFRAITIGGGSIAHSGYDNEGGRAAMLEATGRHGLRIDSLHAPFGQDADLSVPDVWEESQAGQSSPAIPVGESSTETDPDTSVGASTSAIAPVPSMARHSYKPDERRLQAIARVKGAIDAAAALGVGIVVVHPTDRLAADEVRARISAARDSLKELVRYATGRGIRLAAENLASPLSTQVLEVLLEQLPDLGVCYDSSHAQICGDALGLVGRHSDRIIAVHLSDNLSLEDDHMLPFEGVLPWDELAYYLPRLKNLNCLMFEGEIRQSAFKDRGEFLAEAFRRARQVLDMAGQGRFQSIIAPAVAR